MSFSKSARDGGSSEDRQGRGLLPRSTRGPQRGEGVCLPSGSPHFELGIEAIADEKKEGRREVAPSRPHGDQEQREGRRGGEGRVT